MSMLRKLSESNKFGLAWKPVVLFGYTSIAARFKTYFGGQLWLRATTPRSLQHSGPRVWALRCTVPLLPGSGRIHRSLQLLRYSTPCAAFCLCGAQSRARLRRSRFQDRRLHSANPERLNQPCPLRTCISKSQSLNSKP